MSPLESRLAVVLPSYNVAPFLPAALRSLQAQTVRDWEAIVVDDGSTDATADVARAFAANDPRIRVIVKPNGGVSSARNAGQAAMAPSIRAVMFLDPDDLLDPDALEVLSWTLDQRPECEAVYGLPRSFVEHDGRVEVRTATVEAAEGFVRRGFRCGRLVRWPTDAPTTFEVLVFWPAIQTGGQVLFRRHVASATPFDESLLISQDWDVWLRVTAKGPIGFLPRLVMSKRDHPGNVTKRSRLMARGEPIVRRKWQSMSDWTPRQRRLLRLGHRRAALFRLEWALNDVRRGDPRAAAAHARQAVRAYLDYWLLHGLP